MQLNNIQFILEDLVYYPTRSHNPMLLRPYLFNVENTAVDAISSRLAETKSGKITPAMLNGLTSSFVQPSSVGYDSPIDANWASTSRFLFMLKVRYIDHLGCEIVTYIFGYTEFDGITQTGHIDMNMTHYVNNVIETTVFHITTPTGVKRVEKLVNIYNAIYSTSQVDIYTQRPVDLYQTISNSEMANFFMPGGEVQSAINLVSPFSNNVITSTAENGITTEYLSKILTSGMHAVKSREIHVNSYQIGSSDPSERFFTEPSVSDSVFLRALSRAGGSRVTKPVFNFNALMQIDDTIYSRFKMFNLTNDFSSPILSRTPEVGEYWYGQDIVTLKAFSLMENSVSMATKYGFTKMSFIASNMGDMLGGISFAVLDFNSFMSLSQHDFNYLLGIFEEKFKTEIFINETNYGKIPLHMECHINLLGSSKIYLEYSGMPGNWFTVPTFASSLYSSVISLDKNTVEYSASQLSNTLNELVDANVPSYY